MTTRPSISHTLPPRRYLTREEAAGWLGVGIDTFSGLDIPHVDFGPRCKRWDIVDIEAYAEHNKSRNSARTSAEQKGRQKCVFINTKTHPSGGSIGGTRQDVATVEALGLKTRS